MATGIICILLLLVCIFSIKSYMKRLTHGCCGSVGGAEKKIRVKDRNKANYPYYKKLWITGMTCEHCKNRVENAFHEKEGIYASVDLRSNTASVWMKQDWQDEALAELVRSAGYGVAKIE